MKLMDVCAFALACAGVVSCSSYEFEDVKNCADTKDVQFVMKGLQVDYSTRATLSSEGITDLWVWEGTSMLCHQTSSDASFGSPTISLSVGAHDLTFVASKSDGQSFSSGVWKCTKVKDTYGSVLAYTVTKSTSTKQVELSRMNAKVQWTMEDEIPSDAKMMTVEVSSQCYGLDAQLNGVNDAKYSVSADISSRVGSTGYCPSIMVLPANSDGSSVVASIKISDASGNAICNYDNEVVVKSNTIVNIHGSLFSGDPNVPNNVSISPTWGEQKDYDIR